MIIRKASSKDAHDLKVLYFDYLTSYPPKEEQDMKRWENILDKLKKDDKMHLLVLEEDGKVVSIEVMVLQ